MKLKLENIETRFKEVSGLPLETDISYYPIIEHIGFEIRLQEKKQHGEVFTPLELVDRMLEISKPETDKYNLDLCAGYGQFTVRILRRFISQDPNFNIDLYLKNLHWFNELNIDSAKKLVYIFREKINLAVGPAQELKNYPCDSKGIWLKGIFFYDSTIKKWVSKDIKELNELSMENINSNNKINSKALF